MPEGRARNQAPFPALPAQLLPGTEGERMGNPMYPSPGVWGDTPLPPPNLALGWHPLVSPFQRQAGSVLNCGVNPSSTFYVLNPHRNLLGTEERFRAWFERWVEILGAFKIHGGI